MAWPTVKLGEICQIEKEQFREGNLPYVGMEDIEGHTGRFLGERSPKSVASSTFKFSDKHVLYGRLRPYLNKVLVPGFEGHCSSEIFPLKPSDKLNRKFLYYWLSSEKIVSAIDATCTGARMPRANVKEVLTFDFSLPSLPEQKRIVAILDQAFADIDQARALTEQNLKNARELFESYLQQVFSQRGEGWTIEPLENAVTKDCTLSYGIVQPGDNVAGGLPVVRPTDLIKEVIDLSGLKQIDPSKAEGYMRTLLQGGELLVCVRGSTGTTSIASEELSGANVTRGIVPIRFNPEKISQRFGYYQFISPAIQTQIQAGTYGAALMQINIRDLRKLKVRIPSLEVQQKITDQLDSIKPDLERIEAIYSAKLNAFEELRSSLLEKAFSGALTTNNEKAVA
ncbi:restriction endonuclease subunit S [Halopseudomonas salegens]|uniref:Type I restriction enzyme, S subunit n=1 Tax=Halopseudomonas salegens TaxID=1434072 RepID=A0A1H2HE93_9GAMM|nr:restriction endonuclease subunit S [Halopseudomonas salegens]SDU30072.1 type I restriction enzyme, S subunit [Halopseudomonas salegens]